MYKITFPCNYEIEIVTDTRRFFFTCDYRYKVVETYILTDEIIKEMTQSNCYVNVYKIKKVYRYKCNEFIEYVKFMNE